MTEINWFKNILSRKRKPESKIMSSNPWAGVESYEDPAHSNTSRIFCGRTRESKIVTSLIDNNLHVTLYGKSGIGKTSLLNAGVSPLLRDEGYFPLYMRLEYGERCIGFSSQLINNLEKALIQEYGEKAVETIPEISEIKDTSDSKFLWNYFARHRFYNASREIIFPVIIFDQFEEAVRGNRNETTSFLKQLSFISDSHNVIQNFRLNGSEYRYDYNFRFLLSIREDDLYCLEDILDNNFLGDLKLCRFRLQNLNEKEATDIISINNKDIFDSSSFDEIKHLIIDASKGKDGLIRTNVLSLICFRLYDKIENGELKKIGVGETKTYLSSNPFQDYYSFAVKNLTEKEKKYLEDHLVTSDGRRSRVPESEILENIRYSDNLLRGKSRLLNRLYDANSPESNNVELLHDGLCSVLQANRSIRLEIQRNRAFRMTLLSYFAVAFLVIWNLLGKILHECWLLQNHNKDLQIYPKITYVIGIVSELAAQICFVCLVSFYIPKIICEYFNNSLRRKSVGLIIVASIILLLLGIPNILVNAFNLRILQLLGWLLLFLLICLNKILK